MIPVPTHLTTRDIDSYIHLAELEADIERDTLQLLDLGSKGDVSLHFFLASPFDSFRCNGRRTRRNYWESRESGSEGFSVEQGRVGWTPAG